MLQGRCAVLLLPDKAPHNLSCCMGLLSHARAASEASLLS